MIRRFASRRRPSPLVARVVRPIGLGALVLSGCSAPGASGPAPRPCAHFRNGLARLENVPNCEFRSRDTLINGLQPSYPGNKS